MDMTKLKQLDSSRWTTEAGADNVLLYGSRDLLESMDDKVLEQITNVSQLPGRVGPAMTMPDAHWGYGFPIGGVAAFDPAQGGIVSAGGVGYDISCGIRFLRTNLRWKDIEASAWSLSGELFQHIPAGVGEEGEVRLSDDELDEMLRGGARWALDRGFGTAEDLEYVEETGTMPGAKPEFVSDMAKRRQRGQMGTLGSGNHYLEVQMVDRVFDRATADAWEVREGQVCIAIHCGSRGLGHQIGSDYLLSMAKAASRLGITLPDRELACAPIESKEGQEYLGAMAAGVNCALANRQILTHLTREVFARTFPGATIETLYDVSHNTCKREVHVVGGIERTLYIHRKGATRALGPGHPALPVPYRATGQPVVIGGSMGTGSYLLAGTPESEERAFSSASHGAGRSVSRRAALKRWRGRQLVDELREAGIIIRTKSMRGVAEEAPDAYKDVDSVARATEHAGLARRVAVLRPKVCVKG
ncbi:MAG: RtcB family protein [Dehalococcoidia bacterium]|nr:RtcB family protein [Dehalococcoidia bacterium]